MQLEDFFRDHSHIAIAFSGGVDSAYLLYAAKQYGCVVHAYFVKSPFQPQFELEDARRFAEELGVSLDVVSYDVFSIPEAVENGHERCYFCKHALLSLLCEHAAADGFSVVCDGTNASDDSGDRPGMRALAEKGVFSPLRMCGLTKDQIRSRSKQAGLFTHDKPAYACLATRIPTGTPITREQLEKIERAENVLFSLGFSDFRVRVFGDAAKLQFPPEQLERTITVRQEIVKALIPDFSAVLLDLQPRQ